MRKISYDVKTINREGDASTNIMKMRWASVEYYTITLPATRKVFRTRKTAVSFLRALAHEVTDLYTGLFATMNAWDSLQAEMVLSVGCGRWEHRMISNRSKRFAIVSKVHRSLHKTRESRGYSMSAVYEDFMMMGNLLASMTEELDYLMGNMKRSEYWSMVQRGKAMKKEFEWHRKMLEDAQIEGYDYVVVSIAGGAEMVEPTEELLIA